MKAKIHLSRIQLFVMLIVTMFSFVAACSKEDKDNSPSSSTRGVNEVWIYESGFDPVTLTVPVNTTVMWINKDNYSSHTVTSDNNVFQTEPLNTGNSYSYKFTTSGTYAYHCTIHPQMKAKIIVQ